MFDENTTIGEVLRKDESLKEVLMGFGMHCFDCPCAQMETLGEAAEVHDIEINFLLDTLNKSSKCKKSKK